jgi:hypothetical protein
MNLLVVGALFVLGICAPAVALGLYWGIAKTGLHAAANGLRPNTTGWIVRLAVQPSPDIPTKRQPIYAATLMIGVVIIIGFVAVPLFVLVTVPGKYNVPIFIPLSLVCFPLIFWKAFNYGRRLLSSRLERHT